MDYSNDVLVDDCLYNIQRTRVIICRQNVDVGIMTFFAFRIRKKIKNIETKNKTLSILTGAEVLRRGCFRVVLVAVAALSVPS